MPRHRRFAHPMWVFRDILSRLRGMEHGLRFRMAGMLGFSPFRLDLEDERLWRGNTAVDLRPKTFAVLRYLAERPGRLVRHAELLDTVWAGTIVTPGTLNTSIRELRKALDDDARQPRFIETVHRRGFRFVADVDAPASAVDPPAPTFVPVHMAPAPAGLHGRDAELEALEARLAEARGGVRRVVFVTGEAGIGKTSVVRAFVDRHAADTVGVVWGQCVHRRGEGEAYYPVLDGLGRALRREGTQVFRSLLRRYAPTWALQLPWILEEQDARDLVQGAEGVSTARMLREFNALTEAVGRERPLVLVLEDLHWSDPATVDLIEAQARRTDPARVLLIATYRPVDAATERHPIAPLHRSVRKEAAVTDLVLGPIPETAVTQYLCERFDWEQAPPGMAEAVHEQTDGNPLLMVTLVSHLVSTGLLAIGEDGWTLSVPSESLAERAPEGLQEIVDEQLESLDRSEREALEVASVAGESFVAQAVAAGLGVEQERVEETCGRLARWGQFIAENGVGRWPDGSVGRRFDFQHAAFRRILYGRLSPVRRRLLHLRIARRLEDAFADDLDARAVALAEHYEQGDDPTRAVLHLVRAAAAAKRRLAHREAAAYARRAIDLLRPPEEGPTVGGRNLGLRLELGRSIAEGAFRRRGDRDGLEPAMTLCQALVLAEANKNRDARSSNGERLGLALHRLSAEEREVVRLRYLAGHSGDQIARMTGATPGSVSTRLLTGLRQLGHELGDQV